MSIERLHPPQLPTRCRVISQPPRPLLFTAAKPHFIRGSRANTISLVLLGFRFTRDGKPTVDGRQAWRCVHKKDKCPGRVYTLGDSAVGTPKPHCHPSNFTECEVKEIYAKVLRVTTTAPPSQILTAVKRGASEAAILNIPKNDSFKRALNKYKRKAQEIPSSPAPATLTDLNLDPSLIESFKGDPMLVCEKEEAHG